MLKTYIIPAILLFSVTGLGAEEIKNKMSIPDLKTMRTMIGIDPGKYDRFWEKWPLVTARFRPDKGEQRFIYANPVAYETMKEGLLTFPDGSVFGKVAFISKEDPQFPNSFEPSNYSRLQLMVKDSKKFNDTDGWSYWLHTDSAKALPSEDKSNMMACHACHALVKEKDYIFSAPTFLAEKSEWYGKIGDRFRDKFQTRAYSHLTEFEKNVVELLPEKPETGFHIPLSGATTVPILCSAVWTHLTRHVERRPGQPTKTFGIDR